MHFIIITCTHMSLKHVCMCVKDSWACAQKCVSSHTSSNHNDIVRSALPAQREVHQGNLGSEKNSPSSNFYPSIHASFLPPSAPLFLLSWWGDPDVWGGGAWTGRGSEGARNPPHPPLVTDLIVQGRSGRALRRVHTNNYVRQTMESL